MIQATDFVPNLPLQEYAHTESAEAQDEVAKECLDGNQWVLAGAAFRVKGKK